MAMLYAIRIHSLDKGTSEQNYVYHTFDSANSYYEKLLIAETERVELYEAYIDEKFSTTLTLMKSSDVDKEIKLIVDILEDL